MTLTIHRGTHETGGSYIEIATAGARVFLDPCLPPGDKEGRPRGLEDRDDRPFATFLTHAHLDPEGLAPWLPEGLPAYASLGTRRLLDFARFFGPPLDLPGPSALEAGTPLEFCGLAITPYPVDHPLASAFAYLVEAEGKRIFYSGDIHAHGRGWPLFEGLVAAPPGGVDCLVLEGSAPGEEGAGPACEAELEARLTEELAAPGLCLASLPSLDLDHLLSLHGACVATGRTLVLEPRTAMLLDALAGTGRDLPRPGRGDGFRVFLLPDAHTQKMAKGDRLSPYGQAKIGLPEIAADPSRLVMQGGAALEKILRGSGLLAGSRAVQARFDARARAEDLIRLVQAFDPGLVIPNHGYYPDSFVDLFESGAKVLEDGEVMEL